MSLTRDISKTCIVGPFNARTFALDKAVGTGTATVNGVEVITVAIDQPFISLGPADNLIVHLLAHFTITPNDTAVDFTVISVECHG